MRSVDPLILMPDPKAARNELSGQVSLGEGEGGHLDRFEEPLVLRKDVTSKKLMGDQRERLPAGEL